MRGSFSPQALLSRPRLADYAAFLTKEGFAAITSSGNNTRETREDEHEHGVGHGEDKNQSSSVDGVPSDCKPNLSSGDHDDGLSQPFDVGNAVSGCISNCDGTESDLGDNDAIALLHQAASAGAVPLLEFLVEKGYVPVDGGCCMKRLR